MMIGRELAIEMLSEELRVSAALADLSASGHQRVLNEAIKEAKASSDLSIAAVESLLKQKLAEVRQKPCEVYGVVIPLSFNLFHVVQFEGTKELRVVVQGTEIVVGPIAALAPASLQNISTLPSSKQSPILGLVAAASLKVKARDPFFAALKAWAPANTLAAMIQICCTSRVDFKWPAMPIGGIALQRCAIVLQHEQHVGRFGTLEPVEEAPDGLGLQFDSIWNQVKKLESRLIECENASPRELMASIYKALEMYAEAANDSDPNLAVMKFWIGLENMMRAGQDLDVRTVARRLRTAFRRKPEIWDDEVRRLLQKRNELVHRGLMECTVQDAYFAKMLLELTLFMLLGYGRKGFGIDAIRTLLDFGNASPQALGEVKSGMEYLFRS
jgi:hypothetical protein